MNTETIPAGAAIVDYINMEEPDKFRVALIFPNGLPTLPISVAWGAIPVWLTTEPPAAPSAVTPPAGAERNAETQSPDPSEIWRHRARDGTADARDAAALSRALERLHGAVRDHLGDWPRDPAELYRAMENARTALAAVRREGQ